MIHGDAWRGTTLDAPSRRSRPGRSTRSSSAIATPTDKRTNLRFLALLRIDGAQLDARLRFYLSRIA